MKPRASGTVSYGKRTSSQSSAMCLNEKGHAFDQRGSGAAMESQNYRLAPELIPTFPNKAEG